MANEKYTFKENSIGINDLILGIDGWVDLQGDDVDMDLKFNTNEPTFKSLLSLLPGIYLEDFKDIETKGSLILNGMATTPTTMPPR